MMRKEEMEITAQALVQKGKGLLAADESTGAITRRFEAVGVESTEDTRRAYREMLFTAQGLEDYLSGVILFDETIRQNASNGKPLREILHDKGIIPGIKVDKGAKDLAHFPGEKITEGLDGLRERLAEYRDLGARFAKWRAVITIGEGIPSATCINSNMEALARYAALVQEAELVPIVEPEVLMDGSHTIDRCREATRETLRSLFSHLDAHRVMLEGLILKPNMVIPGKDSPEQVSVGEVAQATVEVLKETVPPAVPGIVFLSGGQDAELATRHLNAMNQMGHLPWVLTFSYARALHGPALEAWRGMEANVPHAQRVLLTRAMCNSAAALGQYSGEMEKVAA